MVLTPPQIIVENWQSAKRRPLILLLPSYSGRTLIDKLVHGFRPCCALMCCVRPRLLNTHNRALRGPTLIVATCSSLHPIKQSYSLCNGLPARLMIYRENPRKIPVLEKNPQSVTEELDTEKLSLLFR
jgi:hypothetical protein